MKSVNYSCILGKFRFRVSTLVDFAGKTFMNLHVSEQTLQRYSMILAETYKHINSPMRAISMQPEKTFNEVNLTKFSSSSNSCILIVQNFERIL